MKIRLIIKDVQYVLKNFNNRYTADNWRDRIVDIYPLGNSYFSSLAMYHNEGMLESYRRCLKNLTTAK